MTDLSAKTLSQNKDAKNYIENYWSKRADSFAELRRQELHSEKYQLWQQELTSKLPTAKKLRILDVGCGCRFLFYFAGPQRSPAYRHRFDPGHDRTGS